MEWLCQSSITQCNPPPPLFAEHAATLCSIILTWLPIEGELVVNILYKPFSFHCTCAVSCYSDHYLSSCHGHQRADEGVDKTFKTVTPFSICCTANWHLLSLYHEFLPLPSYMVWWWKSFIWLNQPCVHLKWYQNPHDHTRLNSERGWRPDDGG